MRVLRLVLAVSGFAAALLAVSTGDRRIGWAAIALLLMSLIIRLVQRIRARAHRENEPER